MSLRIHGLGMVSRQFSAPFFCTFADGTLGMLTLLTSGLTKAGQLMSNVYYWRLYTHLHTEAYLP